VITGLVTVNGRQTKDAHEPMETTCTEAVTALAVIASLPFSCVW